VKEPTGKERPTTRVTRDETPIALRTDAVTGAGQQRGDYVGMALLVLSVAVGLALVLVATAVFIQIV
jgi:hypothetical protein